MKYRKLPVVIDAHQFTGTKDNALKLVRWIRKYGGECDVDSINLNIKTPEGYIHASICDFIIKGVNGEFYPCKPDIFEKTYEPIINSSEDKK